MNLLRPFLLFTLPVAAAVTPSTEISAEKPVVNFSTTAWTADNHRAWLLRASEARRSRDQIEVKELTLSIFPGKADNEKIETLILSPSATVRPDDSVVTGKETIRLINDQLEAAGSDWRYEHNKKKVSIHRNVRVVFRAELNDILK